MPGAAFKRNALAVRVSCDRMLTIPFEMVKRNKVACISSLTDILFMWDAEARHRRTFVHI
jgi:hypothetical protein